MDDSIGRCNKSFVAEGPNHGLGSVEWAELINKPVSKIQRVQGSPKARRYVHALGNARAKYGGLANAADSQDQQ
jgi:hypothetical protein